MTIWNWISDGICWLFLLSLVGIGIIALGDVTGLYMIPPVPRFGILLTCAFSIVGVLMVLVAEAQ